MIRKTQRIYSSVADLLYVDSGVILVMVGLSVNSNSASGRRETSSKCTLIGDLFERSTGAVRQVISRPLALMLKNTI